MQLFKEMEDMFFQELPEGIFDMDQELFGVGKEIKVRLGDDGYLLDNYLAMILEAIRGNSMHEVFADGEDAFKELHYLYRNICEGKDVDDEDIQKRRLYPEVKKYYDLYSGQHKSRYTVLLRTFIAVTPLVIKKLYAEGKMTYGAGGRLDTARVKELYEQMSVRTGSELLDRIGELVKSRFIITPAVNVYIQVATDEYLCSLLERDEVTSKQMFQLILDEHSGEVKEA